MFTQINDDAINLYFPSSYRLTNSRVPICKEHTTNTCVSCRNNKNESNTSEIE